MGLCLVYARVSGLYVLRLYQPCLRTSLIGIWGNTSLVPVLYQFQISISEIYLPHTSQKSVFDPIETGLGWYEKFSKYQVPGLVYSTLDTRGKPIHHLSPDYISWNRPPDGSHVPQWGRWPATTCSQYAKGNKDLVHRSSASN
jgi:hypothetical protein